MKSIHRADMWWSLFIVTLVIFFSIHIRNELAHREYSTSIAEQIISNQQQIISNQVLIINKVSPISLLSK